MSDLSDIGFEALFARSPNPYVVMDRDLRIAWMNDAYLAATMRSRADILGQPLFDAFPSDPASESFRLLDASLRKVIDTGEPDDLALIRYDLRAPDGSMAERFWSATHTPLHDADGRTAFILQHTVDVTELHGLRRLRDEMGLVQRAGAIQAQNRTLQLQTERMTAMFAQAPGFVAVVAGPSHRFQMANAAYLRLIGRSEIVGKTVSEVIPEVVEQGFIDVLDAVGRDGKPYVGHRELIRLKKAGSDEIEQRYLNFIFQPIVENGSVEGIFIQGHDVTDEVAAFEAQQLLINELNHRVKNTLAIVQGLASQSFRNLSEAAAARGAFDARLNALAAAHRVLTDSNWEGADLATIVRGAVEAAAGESVDRVSLDGPDIALPPQTAVSLAMIVHELITNAIKYGAFANAAGSIAMSWALERRQRLDVLVIDWVESGGPPVSEPSRRGFGARLIERGLSTDGGGTVTLAYPPEGFRCRIEARLAVDGPSL